MSTFDVLIGKTQGKIAAIMLLAFCFFSACSITKFVPEGEYLLDKVSIESDIKKPSKDDLRGYLRQTPTYGLFKISLGIYSLAGSDTSLWYNRTLKKIGTPPMLYSPSLTSVSTLQMQLAMQNKGYINAQVSDSIVKKNKKVQIIYRLKSNQPYRIGNYANSFENEVLRSVASDTAQTRLKTDMLFDVDMLDSERERIADRLRDAGFFHFTKEMLSFEADSVLNTHKIDVMIGLNESLKNAPDSISDLIFRTYRIRNVVFSLAQDFTAETDSTAITPNDTLTREGFVYIAPSNHFLRFNTLIQNTYIIPKQLYSNKEVDKTYSSLNSLSAIKYANLNFKTVSDTLLDCYIYLATAKTVNFSVEAETTFTQGYWGIAANINTQHKNLFHGSETLTLQARTALEWQGDIFAQEYGGQAALQFPNFLLPFSTTELKRRVRAKTEFSASYSYQFRPQEYTKNNFGGGIKYLWNRGQTYFTLNLIDLDFVYFPEISKEFFQKYLQSGIYNYYNYDNHLIMRMNYSVSVSRFNSARPLHSFSTFKYNIEMAGNILYGLSHLFDFEKNGVGQYFFAKIKYAQYIKGDFSLSYNQIFGENNRFVYRVAAGLGIPYGNSDLIPYERRFFSGGANSVRGWNESALGPGAYQRITPRGRRDFNQTGDIKLDLNMEYRTKMFWPLEGALFLDAGNIWTVKEYPQQEGGVFRFDTFFNQIALSYGIGLRADFSFFLLRFDVGVKLRDPALSRRESWRIKPNFADDFALHIAIGYPF